MLFNSLTFVVFYVIVTTLYWSFRGWELRKNLLVVASYIFYGAWNPTFAALLFTTTAMDFWLGRQMGKAQTQSSKKRWLVASVCMNLSMLGFFKYGNFLLQNFQSRRAEANALASRFHSRGFIFSAVGRRPNRARRRFPPPARTSAAPQNQPVFLGPRLDDAWTFRKNRARRYVALRPGRSCLRLRRSACCDGFVGRRARVCRTDLFRFRGLFNHGDRRRAHAWLS